METQKHPALINTIIFFNPDLNTTKSGDREYVFRVVISMSHPDQAKITEVSVLTYNSIKSALEKMPSCYKVELRKTINKFLDYSFELNVGEDWNKKDYIENTTTTFDYLFYCSSEKGVLDPIVEELSKHTALTYVE